MVMVKNLEININWIQFLQRISISNKICINIFIIYSNLKEWMLNIF